MLLFTTAFISQGADLGLSQLNSIPLPPKLLEVGCSPGPDNSLTVESARSAFQTEAATKISIIRKGNIDQEALDILSKTLEDYDVKISQQKCSVSGKTDRTC